MDATRRRAAPAFELYVFLGLHVNRHGARMIWEPMEVAKLPQRDRRSVIDGLEELCRREVCSRYALALDRSCIEIGDRGTRGELEH